MAVDRGGLQYTISIRDAFSTPLDAFINGVREARRELDGLRTSSRGLRETSTALRDVRRVSRETRTESAAAAREEVKNAGIRAESQRRVNRETREAAIEQRRASIELRNRLNNARRLQTQEQQTVRAEREVTRILDARGRSERLLAAAQARRINLTDEERRKARLLSAEEKDLLSTRERLSRVSRAGGGELAQINAEAEALRRKNRVAREAAVTEILRRQGLDPSGRALTTEDQLAAATRRRTEALERLRGVLGRVDQQANRVSFTFRRLFGILAAFAAARAVLRGFRNIVAETVRFNAAIEQATLGVASLFLAVGDVRDITGAAVNATQGLAMAQAEARKQVALLRRDALKTSATFEQLLDTFQVAVAPGFQAGLEIDQIRKFTLDISRAAGAIGLAQNQLAEEIRSLLSGTIQTRTTRIAVALGITNEDIRNAREAGVLFEFLQEKFSAFDAAGEEALNTFNALWKNLIGGFQQVLGQGGLEFFNELKGILAELFDLLVNQDPLTETLTPDPRAVAVVQAFTAALKDGLLTAREVAQSISFEDFVGSSRAVGAAIRTTATIVASLIKGTIQGFRDLARLANGIGRVFQAIFGESLIDTDALQETLAIGARILTVFLGISAATALIKLAMSGVVLVVGVLLKAWTVLNGLIVITNGLVVALNALLAPLSLPAWATVAAVVALIGALVIGVKLLKDWFDEIAGVELKFKSFLKLVAVNARFVFEDTVNTIAKLFDTLLLRIQNFFSVGLQGVFIETVKLFERLLELLAKISDSAAALLEDVRQFRAAKESALGKQIIENALELERTAAAYQKASQDLRAKLEADTQQIIKDDATEETLAEFARRVVGNFASEIGSFFKEIFDGLLPDIDALSSQFILDEDVRNAQSLTDAFDELGGVIARNREGLEANVELVENLRDAAREAQEDLDLSRSLRGLEGPTAGLITAISKTRNELAREAVDLEKQQQQALTNRLGLQNKIFANERRILDLSVEQTRLLNESQSNLRAIATLQRQRAEADNRRLIAEITARQATVQGFDTEAKAAQAKADAEGETVRALDEQIEKLRQLTDSTFENTELSIEQRDAVREALLARLQLQGQLQVAEESLQRIAEDQLELEQRRNSILSRRLTLLAEEAAFESSQEQIGQQAELLRLIAQQEALAIRNNAAQRQRIAAAELAATKLEIEAAQALRNNELNRLTGVIEERAASLQQLRDQLAAGIPDASREAETLTRINELEAERAALIELRTQLTAQNQNQREIELIQLREAARIAEEERRKLEEPIEFGFIQGVQDFIDESLDLFTSFQSIVADGFKSLAQTLGSSITSALTGEGTNFREAFRRFLSQVAEQIISMLVQVAIAKALLGLGFLGGAEGGQISLAGLLGGGLAKGGPVDGVKPRKMVLHSPFLKAPGFAAGGLPRPSGERVPNSAPRAIRAVAALRPRGLDPSDRIPIWTAPGEWVVRAKAVKLYGNDVMDALNSMLIDPAALRAIAGINTKGRVTRKVSHSAATGGQITSTSGAPVVSTQSSDQRSGTPPLAVVVGNEDTMQQLLRGGGPVLKDWLRRNRDEFMGEERRRR